MSFSRKILGNDRWTGNSKSIIKCDTIILDDKSKSDTIPKNIIENNLSYLEHEATVSKLDEEKLFYLMSRGLIENNAKRLIINANYNIVIDKILDEKTKELVRKEINNRL